VNTPTKHKTHTPQKEDSTQFVEDQEFFEPKLSLWKHFTSIFVSKKKIGELNGKWAFMFKFVILFVVIGGPTVLGWMTWVNNSLYAMQAYQITTQSHEQRIAELESSMKILARVEVEISRISTKMDNLPPPDWRRRIEILEDGREQNAVKIETLDTNNTTQHSDITVMLKEINTKLEFLTKGNP
jgi:hypothetical protein